MALNANEKIRNENIKSVFRAVAEGGCRTRSDIAKHTGISLVTCGKIVEDLLDTGIFLQKESRSKSVGRHAGRLSYDSTKNILCVDLSGKGFSFSVYDFSMKLMYSSDQEHMADLTYAEEICRFMHRIKSFMKRKTEHGMRFMALGIIVPGKYDRKNDVISDLRTRNFEGIRIKDYIRSTVGIVPDCIMDNTSAALRYCSEGSGSKGNTLYINIGDVIEAGLISDGKNVNRNGFVVDGFECGERKRECALTASLTIMNVFGLDRVVLTADMPSDATAVKEKLTDVLSDNRDEQRIPEIKTMLNHECSCLGVASMLRWKVIERRIKKLF